MSDHAYLNRQTRGYDPSTETFHAHHDSADPEDLTETVVTAVAAATGNDPVALPPLADVLDTDALNALFCTPGAAGAETDRFQFSYAEFRITVYRNGHVVVQSAPVSAEHPT